ncbi:MAG TPA: TA system VapC family ribonuclease toxin [Steroidobacteraceae bacterium]
MIVPDANLLLYACDSASPFHERARNWWQECLSGDEAVGLTHPTLFAFLRISTNPRVFANPLTLAASVTQIRSWLARRVCQVLQASADHTSRVVALLESAGGTAGNLVTDAQIGALAIAYRAVVHTADRDFLRFADVRCHFPLDA